MTLSVPKGQSASALADWIELHMLIDGRDVLAAASIDRLLRGEATDAADEEFAEDARPPTDEEDTPDLDLFDPEAALAEDEDTSDAGDLEVHTFDEGEDERDVRIEYLLAEVDKRLEAGENLYPFERRSERVARRAACGSEIYRFLLVLSSDEAPFREDRRAHQVEAAYDRVCLEAMRRYLGRNATAVRLARNAHDPDDPNARPKKFRAAIVWLRGHLDLKKGERLPPDEETDAHWESEGAEALGREPLNTYSDAGVDVVVWWHFKDGRAGFPVLLAQCTVQLTWEDKLNDVKVKLWEKWIDFSTVPPQTALVIPFAVDRELPQWADRTVDAGVIIDRIRLLELLDELECETLEKLIDNETTVWVDTELNEMAA